MESVQVLWNRFMFCGIVSGFVESFQVLWNRSGFVESVQGLWNRFRFCGIGSGFVESVQVLWCRLRRVKDCEKELHSEQCIISCFNLITV